MATENFHLSVDIGMNISSLPNLEQDGSTTGLYFVLGTFIKINDKWALTPEFSSSPLFYPFTKFDFFQIHYIIFSSEPQAIP